MPYLNAASSNTKREFHDGMIFAMANGTVSTEGYDRGGKFFFYKQIPSLQSYILVDQYQPLIDLYTRKSDLWKINRMEGLDQKTEIPSLDIQLDMRDLYLDVFS